jgi:hypothetical protein
VLRLKKRDVGCSDWNQTDIRNEASQDTARMAELRTVRRVLAAMSRGYFRNNVSLHAIQAHVQRSKVFEVSRTSSEAREEQEKEEGRNLKMQLASSSTKE